MSAVVISGGWRYFEWASHHGASGLQLLPVARHRRRQPRHVWHHFLYSEPRRRGQQRAERSNSRDVERRREREKWEVLRGDGMRNRGGKRRGGAWGRSHEGVWRHDEATAGRGPRRRGRRTRRGPWYKKERHDVRQYPWCARTSAHGWGLQDVWDNGSEARNRTGRWSATSQIKERWTNRKRRWPVTWRERRQTRYEEAVR